MKNIFPTLLLCLSFVAGCTSGKADYVLIEELDYAFVAEDGSYIKDDGTFAVPAEGGSMTFRLLANAPVTLVPRGDMPQWAQVDRLSLDGDGDFTVTMEANNGFRRGVTFDVYLEDSDKKIVLTAKQDGLVPFLECSSPYRTVKGSESSSVNFILKTNLPREEITVSHTYVSGSGKWLSNIDFDGELLVLTTAANPNDVSRKASVELKYKDGWNEYHVINLYLTQSSSSDTFGTPLSFEELRARSSQEQTKYNEDYTITGVIVSDCHSANMDENPCLPEDAAGGMTNLNVSQSTMNNVMQVVDTTVARKTAYIQSEDGRLGFRLVFDKMEYNKLSFGTRLTLSLAGATVIKETDPLRYTISGLGEENMLESITGVAVAPKVKTIAELTDDDIYTYTGLSGVEFPVKEGSYTDIRENHALWSSVNDLTVSLTDTKRYFYMDGYANLLVDSKGNAICTPVNMLCTWRKPEAGIPQGAGTAYGIIVHNELKRYGDPGRYQLRVVDENGFAGLTDASGWTLIAGWDKGSLNPSYGSATMTCERANATISAKHSYKSITAQTSTTCGISSTYKSINIVAPVCNWYNWTDGEVKSFNGLKMDFSTAGISGDQIMVAFRFYAGNPSIPSSFQAYPSHWCVEYSTDGVNYQLAENADLSGKEYVHLRNITFTKISLGSYSIPTTTSTALGASAHAFCLPSDAFGKEKVSVRIRPYDTVMSALPAVFTGEIENSAVTEHSDISDNVSFQDIFIRYR